jgi:hypothetical protein
MGVMANARKAGIAPTTRHITNLEKREESPMRNNNAKTGATALTKTVRGLAAIALASMPCVALAACGSTTQDSACAGHAPMMDTAGRVTAGDCPVNVEVAIDRTAYGEGDEAGEEVAQLALAAANGTLTNGGLLSVTLYTRDADRPVVLYRGEVPLAEEGNQVEVTRTSSQISTALKAAIVAAFEPASQQPPKMRRALAILTGEGSDIATSVGRGIERVTTNDGGRATAVVELTDGWENTPELSLSAAISTSPANAVGRTLARQANVRNHVGIGLLAMPSLGHVPLAYQGSQGSQSTERLRQVWLHACRLLRSVNCDMEST